MKSVVVFLFLVISLSVFSQHSSEKMIEGDKYTSPTKWSANDKHFGYYFIDYSMPIPIDKSLENEFKSRRLKLGYTYRFRIVSKFDLGVEMAYENRVSAIDNNSVPVFDPATFYSKVKTYQNGASGSMYFRFNIADNDYRNLGWFVDLGGFYSQYLWKGTEYKIEDSDISQKARFKKSEYLSDYNYGGFIRMGKNNICVVVSCDFGSWITGFGPENLSYNRAPLMVGLQMNLYAK